MTTPTHSTDDNYPSEDNHPDGNSNVTGGDSLAGAGSAGGRGSGGGRGAGGAQSGGVTRSTRRFVVLVLVAVVAMALGVVVGHWVRSPAQQALDSQPPPRTRITAPVVKTNLQGQLVTRGMVQVGTQLSVGPITASTAKSVVTQVFVRPGQSVAAGSKLVDVSGRPVILLPGTFPAYRDLAPGDSGPDVAQLNAALRSVHAGSPAGNRFTTATSTALAALYRRLDYTAPTGGRMDSREVVFAGVPATVTQVGARVGGSGQAQGLVVLLSGASRITAHADPDAVKSIPAGSTASVQLGASSDTIQATVSQVQVGATAQDTTLVLQPRTPLPASANGTDAKVVIEQHSRTSAPSVPVTAVYTQANGQTAVVVIRSGAESVEPVTTGPVVNGFVTITPTGSRPITVGDQVVVNGA